MLIDTHCHLSNIVNDNFDQLLSVGQIEKIKDIINQAKEAGVEKILNVGTSLIESINSIEIAKNYESVWAAVGIHPNDLTDNWQDDLKQLEKFLDDKNKFKIKAIGECGLDFHYSDYNIEKQKAGFKAQIKLALDYDLPLVIHTRDAKDGVLEILKNYKNSNLRGVIHCFSEDQSFAYRSIELGFKLGIGGTITYPKNNILRETVTSVGLDNIVLETDAPFLPPQYMRGKKNSPKEIKVIAEFIAQLFNTSFDIVAEKTTKNAEKLFCI